LSSEETNQNNNQDSKPNDTYYARKKNWISGVDNDTVNFVLGSAALIVGGIAAYPVAKNIWENFTQRVQQQQAQQQPITNGEAYIPPTGPTEALPQPQQPLLPTQEVKNPIPTIEEQQQAEGNNKEDNEDGVFYENELRRRQKLMGKRPQGRKYESPFGADIGGLG